MDLVVAVFMLSTTDVGRLMALIHHLSHLPLAQVQWYDNSGMQGLPGQHHSCFNTNTIPIRITLILLLGCIVAAS